MKSYSVFKVQGDSDTIHNLDVKLRSLGGTFKDYFKGSMGVGGAAIVPTQYAGKIVDMSRAMSIDADPLNPMMTNYKDYRSNIM